jgi:hypothetical protein
VGAVENQSQLELPILPERGVRDATLRGLGLTFRDSKALPVHRWYPYVEGFSVQYIRERLAAIQQRAGILYDPFGGAGTVNVEASHCGVRSCFSELNPFMRFVAETKTNAAATLRDNLDSLTTAVKSLGSFLRGKGFAKSAREIDLLHYERAFPGRDLFEDEHIRQLLAIKKFIIDSFQDRREIRSILLLAVAARLVDCSNMTRRADLRRRKPGEYKERVVDVRRAVLAKLEDIASDLRLLSRKATKARFVSDNARQLAPKLVGTVDEIITSPPYLNGTNYFRNTKMELWFLDFMETEAGLVDFNVKGVAGGINNVTRSRETTYTNADIQTVASKLSDTDGDWRIARMSELYFSDMAEVLRNCHAYLKPGGLFSLDIGDSKFYGVHVPTDTLLVGVAEEIGFDIVATDVIARRHSRDKTPLKQVEIVMRRPA